MSLQDDLHSMLSTSSVRIPVRTLVSVCGKVVSLINCVGHVSRLMTRNLFFSPRHEFVCLFLLDDTLDGFNVITVGGFQLYYCAPYGQNERFGNQVVRVTKLILDYFIVQAVF